MHLKILHRQIKSARCTIKRSPKDLLLARRAGSGPENRYATCAWNDFLEQLHFLRDCLGRNVGGAGNIATGMREALNQSALDWKISVKHDNRNGSGRIHRRADRVVCTSHDDIDTGA